MVVQVIKFKVAGCVETGKWHTYYKFLLLKSALQLLHLSVSAFSGSTSIR